MRPLYMTLTLEIEGNGHILLTTVGYVCIFSLGTIFHKTGTETSAFAL